MRITRVSPVSVAKVAFVLYAVLGLIIGGVMACAALLGATIGAAHGRRLRGLRCDLRRGRGDLHACCCTAASARSARSSDSAIYNLVAGFVGGIELTLEPIPQAR